MLDDTYGCVVMLAHVNDLIFELEIKKKKEVFIASIYKDFNLAKSYTGWFKIKNDEFIFNFVTEYNQEEKTYTKRYNTNTVKFELKEEERNYYTKEKEFISKQTIIFEKSPFNVDLDESLVVDYPHNFYIWQEVKK